MTTERITDDNGDELEHGEPDFPGQFPDPMTREDPVRAAAQAVVDSAIEYSSEDMFGVYPVGLFGHIGTLRDALAASPADGAGVDVEDADKP